MLIKKTSKKAYYFAVLSILLCVMIMMLFGCGESAPRTDDLQNQPSPAPAPAPEPVQPQEPQVTTLTPAQIHAYNQYAVFGIYTSNDGVNWVFNGSGFFIAPGGIAATNHHVMVTWPYAVARMADGERFPIVGVYSYDIDNDLAIIQVEGPDFQYVTFGDSDAIHRGYEIFTIGSPDGDHNSFFSGSVSNITPIISFSGHNVTYNISNVIQFMAPIVGGSSGGAMFNERGEAVGITTANIPHRPTIAFAVPISRVNLSGITPGQFSPLPLEAPGVTAISVYLPFPFIPTFDSISVNAEFFGGGTIDSFIEDEMLIDIFDYIFAYLLPISYVDEFDLYADELISRHGFNFIAEIDNANVDGFYHLVLYHPVQSVTLLLSYCFNANLVELTIGRGKALELMGDFEPQAQDPVPVTSQLVGEWRATSIPIEPFMSAMQDGWLYDEYFFADGTGISWWGSPATGWHEFMHWTWVASNGQLSTTALWVNEEVVAHYLGREAVNYLLGAIGITDVSTYSIVGNILTITDSYGITYTYQNQNPALPTSQIIGEWRATSIPVEPFMSAMQQHGWLYDEYFLADGTGISWWGSPATGWHEVMHWTWSASNGQITTTLTAINDDVIFHYLGLEGLMSYEIAIGTTQVSMYSVVGNTLTIIYDDGTTFTYQRN